MTEVPSTCEFCSERVDPGAPLHYPHAALDASDVVKKDLQRCWNCRRRGCPRCLRAVEERADDHFLTVFTCSGCLGQLDGPPANS